jgi:hypothetical protein
MAGASLVKKANFDSEVRTDISSNEIAAAVLGRTAAYRDSEEEDPRAVFGPSNGSHSDVKARIYGTQDA